MLPKLTPTPIPALAPLESEDDDEPGDAAAGSNNDEEVGWGEDTEFELALELPKLLLVGSDTDEDELAVDNAEARPGRVVCAND